MKINLNDLTGFSDIGTIVYYPERSFYPELSSVEDEEDLIKQGISTGYLYSTSLTTEYTDFSKTGFKFSHSPEEELLPNLYDFQDTTELIGGIDGFDNIVSVSFPTLKDSEGGEKHFFGRLNSPTDTTYFAHLPKGTRKVEVYSSRVLDNYEGNFVDYDILTKLGKTATNIPSLSIYFGPNYDVCIQDHTYTEIVEGSFPTYLSRYMLSDEIVLTEEEYDSFTEIMTKTEYLESYQEEIKSEKLLYIINTPNGKIDTINFYPLSYPESKNPHPHLNEVALRNDEKDRFKIIKCTKDGLVFDSRSGILLGLRSLSESESPWATEALKNDLYSRSSAGNVSNVNGRIWKKSVPNDVFGENPEISPWWYTGDLPESVFNYYYISTKGKGSTSPKGLVYLGKSKPLTLTLFPERGYYYRTVSNVWNSEIEKLEDNKIQIDTTRYPLGSMFEVLFSEISFKFNLQIDCLKDYPGNKGYKSTYNLFDIGSSTGYNYTPLSNTSIKLFYISKGKEIEYKNRAKIYITDTQELYFRFDTSKSYYKFSGNLRYSDGSEIRRDGDWYVLRVSDFPDTIINSEDKNIIPVGEIETKKYTVIIKADSDIQISTPKKNTLEYYNMDPNSRPAVAREFVSKMILKEGTVKEVKKDGVVEWSGTGEYTSKGKSWSFTKNGDGIWEFRVPSIKNNYEITIK